MYADKSLKAPLIVVECKREEASQGELEQAVEQGFGYANSMRAKYLWMTSGIRNDYFDIQGFEPKERIKNRLADLLHAGQKNISRAKYVKGGEGGFELKTVEEAELTRIFKQAHDALWAGGKRNPAEAFDELDKLIFCKIWDERAARKKGEPYDFQVFTDDEGDDLKQRIQKLYEKGRATDAEVFKEDIRLSNTELQSVVGYLPHLRGVFGQNDGQEDSRCSVLIKSLDNLQGERKRLVDASPLPDSAALLRAIQTVNASYADTRLQRSDALGLFSAFLFFAFQNGARYQQFETWVLKNHQYELKNINASDLIRIFEKIAESRHRQIFVSMQFKVPDKNNSSQLVDNPNWKAIESAVNELNKEFELDLKLKPIRIDESDKGSSYPISSEIFQLIEDSGYLIADLTAGNKNVYHELGLLMGLNQARQKTHDNFLLLHNSSVGDVSKDFGFNIADFKQLRLSDTYSIGEEVKKQVAIYYGLVSG